uniref:hypothetical protein n=1 Tax=Desulfovibrio piger TaxID=901 RepID=UPI0026F0871C
SFLYGASHAARACPIPQRPDFPSAILPLSLPPILDTLQVMAVIAPGGGWRSGGQADVAAPPGLIRSFLRTVQDCGMAGTACGSPRRYTFAFCNGGCGSARHRGNSLSGWTSCRKNCAVAWLTFGVAIFLKIVLLVDTWTTADRGSSPSTRTPRRKQHVEDSVHGICPAHLPRWSG